MSRITLRPHAFASVPAQLASGAAARLVATAIDAVTGLVAVAICVRLLGVSAYGVLAFLFSVVTLVAGLGGLGWGVAATHAISAARKTGDDAAAAGAARAAIRLATIAGAAGAAIVGGVALLSGSIDNHGAALVVALSLAALAWGSTLGWASAAVARALGRVAAAEAPAVAMGAVRLAVLLAVAASGTRSIGAVALAYGGAGLISAAVSLALVRRMVAPLGPPQPDDGSGRRLLRAAAPFAVQGLAGLAITRLDVLVLGITARSSTVGAYEPTLRATERMMQLAAFLALAQFLPAATAMWAGGERAAFERLYRGTTKLCFVASLLGAVALVGFPEQVLAALYGDAYPARPAIVWLLLIGYLPYAALAPSWHALAAAGERRALVVAAGVTFAFMVGTALVLIPLFGAVGAALATGVSVLVYQASMAHALWRRTGVHAFDREMLLLVAGSVALLAAAVVVRHAAGGGTVLTAVAWSLGLWLTFVLAVVAVGIPGRRARLRG